MKGMVFSRNSRSSRDQLRLEAAWEPRYGWSDAHGVILRQQGVWPEQRV